MVINTELVHKNKLEDGDLGEDKKDAKYELLAEKINNLEQSLKQTQVN
jgi:hypothetical protein